VAAHVLSLFGATLVLVAYAANQMGRMDSKALPYLLLNLAGGGILTFFALRARDPGLMLMEGSWVANSLAGIASAGLRRRRP
jgi:hypothetical protein